MAVARKMAVEFYRVILPNSPDRTFDIFLQQTANVPASGRNINRDGNYIRLQEASLNTDFWTGDMIKIRMQHLPVKAALDGDVSSLDLDKNEGLGEETAFLYHVPTRVLAIQRNRNAVTASAFAYYFSHQHTGLDLELDVILEEAAIKKLDRLQSIRSFEIQVAALDHLTILKKQGQSVRGMLALSEYFQAPRINVSLSMGRQKGTLQHVIDAAKRLAKVSATEDRVVEKILITGHRDDQDNTILDLLEHRLIEHVEIHSNDPARFVPFSTRRAALREAWGRRQTEILKMFSVTPG